MNHGYLYHETVQRESEGMTLVSHLASRYAHNPESSWRERIERGLVKVDGATALPDERLRAGQRIIWARPPWEEPAAPLFYAVLHADSEVLAVAKPSGLPTLPGGGFLEHTLLNLVRRRFPGASPVHRLGRGTSGVVLFSLSPETGRGLSKAWRERRVEKTYRALVEGSPPLDTFTVEVPIGPVSHPALDSIHAASAEGKSAKSEVRVIERREGASLVEVRIVTGRPHQIRIHMAACGHPLAGDPLYAAGGGLNLNSAALPGETGYRLHAWKLSFPHPRTGARCEVECRPPRALRAPGDPSG